MRNDLTKTKRKWGVGFKIITAVLSLFVLFTVTVLFVDVPVIRTYKRNVQKLYYKLTNDNERNETIEGRVVESDNFDKMDKQLSFEVPKPTWLPEGYALVYADFVEYIDVYKIEYEYFRDNRKDHDIKFTILTEPPTTEFDVKHPGEDVSISNMSVYITIYENVNRVSAMFINDQGFLVRISGFTDKETMVKIIENMS